ncbi:hydantoin racemase [Thermanaerosceptrum fracticalcis]|uniref:Hydantoin racemase n=1 Tax=Thermanaerosceptrum fracticalcis TaxID=1712410 RepID=A0A7G6DYY0_THEFR|nr:aspartate/glutamate racemase family protein [Thermanaerosceptrum fracticalcis]QNB45034.1 hydantoin racemase [Thermanaerosceptrum fracticalcis]
MEKYRIGVIRVLTTQDPQILHAHGDLLERYFPQFQIETRCIPDQPYGIYDEVTFQVALPKIIKLALEWAPYLDGLIVSCAGDPGVDELRKLLAIPVVGAGTATAAYSLTLGERVGIIGIEENSPAKYDRILGSRSVGYIRPEGVRNTLDLLTEEGREAVLHACRRLRGQGAEAIALACTGMSTAGIVPFLQKEVAIPVADPVIAEGIMMLGQCVHKRAN